jgi:hypothetical protein
MNSRNTKVDDVDDSDDSDYLKEGVLLPRVNKKTTLYFSYLDER